MFSIPCTFRGIPIEVTEYTVDKAPAVKVHSGPNWRYPIVEDLGKGQSRIRVTGFLDPSYATLAKPLLEGLAVAKGSGLLTLPTRGVIYAKCVSCSVNEDLSNMTWVSLELIEQPSPLDVFGDGSASLVDTITDGVADLEDRVTAEFGSLVSAVSGPISGVVSSATSSLKSLF